MILSYRPKHKKSSCNLSCCSVRRNLTEEIENVDNFKDKVENVEHTTTTTTNDDENDADTEESDDETEWKPRKNEQRKYVLLIRTL